MAKILLVYPTMRLLGYRFPYSLLPLANYLRAKGHKVYLFDTQVSTYSNFRKLLTNHQWDLVGFSCLSGPQIKSALEMAKIVRQAHSTLPIVFGGVHPTLLPEQTINHPLVDIVVRQEGEETMHCLAEAVVANNNDLSDIKGLTWQKGYTVISNPDRSFINLDDTPFINFDFLHIKKYVELQRSPRLIYMETSRGCPHKCGFCYDPAFHKRRWRAKSPERVVEEIAYVVKKYGVEQIFFTDDELAVSKSRLADIAELLLKKNIKVQWPVFSRANYIVKYDSEFLKLIKRAGCNWINFGVESGSERILKLINKQITIEQVLHSVEILRQHDFNIGLSFMIGFPGETLEEMYKTFALIDKVNSMSDKIWIGQISAFTPLPGTALMTETNKYGFHEPQSLEEWGDYYYNDPKNLSFLNKEQFSLVRTVALLSKFDFLSNKYRGAGILKGKPLYQIAHYVLWTIAHLRWEKKFFKFPLEWRTLDFVLTKLQFGER